MKDTGISWAHHTFNPWKGCTKVSPGCAHCYAETLSKRNPKVLGRWGDQGTRVVAAEGGWAEMERLHAAAELVGVQERVFCASLADVFEDWKGMMWSPNGNPMWWCEGSMSNSPIPETFLALPDGQLPTGMRMVSMDDIRERLLFLIRDTPSFDWLLLTKRPENIISAYARIDQHEPLSLNVWLGVTVEDKAAKGRIDTLREIPAQVRFLSVEPLLEDLGQLNLKGIDWVIVGGESGPDARPMHPKWAHGVLDQCKKQRVKFHFKQWGAYYPSDDDLVTFKDVNLERLPFTLANGRQDTQGMVPWRKDFGRLFDGRVWDEFPTTRRL